jgi:hypothetical protein
MRYALRVAVLVFTGFDFTDVKIVGDTAPQTPPAHARRYHDWSGDTHLANLDGSWVHQCAEMLESSPWFGTESGAVTAFGPEPSSSVGESVTQRQQRSARRGQRGKHTTSIAPVGRALEIRLEFQYRPIAQPQIAIDFHACGSTARTGKSLEDATRSETTQAAPFVSFEETSVPE